MSKILLKGLYVSLQGKSPPPLNNSRHRLLSLPCVMRFKRNALQLFNSMLYEVAHQNDVPHCPLDPRELCPLSPSPVALFINVVPVTQCFERTRTVLLLVMDGPTRFA
jgi:hypothetical protein